MATSELDNCIPFSQPYTPQCLAGPTPELIHDELDTPHFNDPVCFEQHFTHQPSISLSSCAYASTPEYVSSFSQGDSLEQQTPGFYLGGAQLPILGSPCKSWAGSEDCTPNSYVQLEPPYTTAVNELNFPLFLSSHSSNTCMALTPAPIPRGCLCHHHHHHHNKNHRSPLPIGHTLEMNSINMYASHPYQETAQGRVPIAEPAITYDPESGELQAVISIKIRLKGSDFTASHPVSGGSVS